MDNDHNYIKTSVSTLFKFSVQIYSPGQSILLEEQVMAPSGDSLMRIVSAGSSGDSLIKIVSAGCSGEYLIVSLNPFLTDSSKTI